MCTTIDTALNLLTGLFLFVRLLAHLDNILTMGLEVDTCGGWVVGVDVRLLDVLAMQKSKFGRNKQRQTI